MIIRLIVVDPRPRAGAAHDLVVYQVPENSRELELLQELCEGAGIEFARIEGKRPKRKEEI